MAVTLALLLSPSFGASVLMFQKRTLEAKFYCEGIAAADVNRDGRMDVIAGPYWWEGPAFTTRHEEFSLKLRDRGGRVAEIRFEKGTADMKQRDDAALRAIIRAKYEQALAQR